MGSKAAIGVRPARPDVALDPLNALLFIRNRRDSQARASYGKGPQERLGATDSMNTLTGIAEEDSSHAKVGADEIQDKTRRTSICGCGPRGVRSVAGHVGQALDR